MGRYKKVLENKQRRTLSVSRFLGPLKRGEIAQYRKFVCSKAKELAFPYGYFKGVRSIQTTRTKHGRDSSCAPSAGLVALHKRKLNLLLYHLVLRHQWSEVSGVLSVLLRCHLVENVYEQNYKFDCAPYFWVAMEATKQLAGLQGNDVRFTKMYQVLYDRQQAANFGKDKTKNGAVRLEYALYLMNQQRFEDARLASAPYVECPPFRDHALANLIHGLIFYHEWCKLVKEYLESNHEIQMEDDLDEGVGENEGSFSNNIMDSNGSNDNAMDTDVMSENTSNFETGGNSCSFQTMHQDFIRVEKDNQWEFYDESDTELYDEWSYITNAKVIYNRDLDRSLFPFRLCRSHQGEEYTIPFPTEMSNIHANAIKYLKTALEIDRHTISALLPLVQLMLAGGDVEGAYEEIQKCCEEQRQIIPLRIKSVLLDSLVPKNNNMLIQVYEKLLEIDPTAMHPIEKLTEMHKLGVYRTFNLLNRLAQHLDACSGSISTWKQFVFCFEKIKLEEEKAVHPNMEDTEDTTLEVEMHSSFNSFREECVQAEWNLRGRWWPLKHFRTDSIREDLYTKGEDLLLYKAAACAHVFGPDSEFVLTVENHYNMTNKLSRLSKLKNFVNLAFNLLDKFRTCSSAR